MTALAPVPSFKGLFAASPASSQAKDRSSTAHQRLLRTLLWRCGLRYRKNVRTLPGKPDIVFSSTRVAVFCDGDFWHGRDWRRHSSKLRSGTNVSCWIPKIKANRNRDRRNDRLLKSNGWTGIRLWESDIHRDPECAASDVEQCVRHGRWGRD